MKTISRMTVALLLAFCGLQANAAYPDRTVTIVVPFSAGGAVDRMSRLLAAKMTKSMGQPVIVVNRTGAGGVVGMDFVAKSKPDGYTILYTPNSIAIGPALFRKLPFDARKDLVPVTQLISTTLIIAANPKLGVSSLKELVALAKSKPGKLNFGSSGVADPLQLGMELLKVSADIDMQAIPYRGQGPMVTALLGDQVDLAVMSLSLGLGPVKDGRLRVLAVCGAKRSAKLPGVPTVAESGYPGYNISSWHGLFVPAGTPKEAIDVIQRNAAAAVDSPDIKSRVEAQGNETVGSTPAEFAAKFNEDVERFISIVKKAHIPYQD